MKILELFSGYGTASFALKRLGIDYELVGYSDIDKYANQCFKQNHCKNDVDDKLRLGNVRDINLKSLKDFDLLTGGFPCQSFSIAGKMLGELDTKGTLFYEIIRIAEVKKPKYMLLENVKGLTAKKFKDTFDKILSELDRIGYKVYWKILNSKDYGIPQNRERVWFVCFRKDVEHSFEFPEPRELKIFLKDVLEKNIPNLKDARIFLNKPWVSFKNRLNQIGFLNNGSKYERPNRIYYVESCCFSITHNTTHMPFIYYEDGIRKLTPKECFRLMGFLNDEINLDGLSDTQKYKLAGNGQDVNIVTKIFKEMFK